MKNIISEKEIIGSILYEQESLLKVIDKLSKDDFTDIKNKNIYSRIIENYMSGKPYDIASLSIYKDLDIGYMTEIMGETATSANIEFHLENVQECARKRKLEKTLILTLDALKKDSSYSDTIFKLESNLDTFTCEIKRDNIDMSSASQGFLEHLQEIHENSVSGKKYLGLETGYYDLDRILNGLNKSHLIVVAGLTSAGKSAFVTNLAYNIGKFNNVYFISTEMGVNEIMGRLFMIQSGFNTDNFYQKGGASEESWAKASNSIGQLSHSKIILNDKINTLDKLYSNLNILKNNNKLDLCIVDYLQHIRGEGESAEAKISYVSRTLKGFSQEFEIPIIAVSQYNRSGYSHDVPSMSNLRGSGAIEQDANSVINLYKEKDNESIINLFVEKNRSGRVGNIQLLFDRSCLKFKNLGV